MTSRNERRHQRSEDHIEALGFWLAALAKRTGAEGLSIGTADGLPIAAWGSGVRHEILSAAGSMYAAGEEGAATEEVPDLRAWALESAGMHLVFTCVGATIEAPEVVPHVQRILAH